jgi:Tol biopolymer transport system component
MKTVSLLLTLLSFLLVSSITVAAAEKQWQENRLIPLQKITVGPWDNFEATATNDDQFIYFTRDRNQILNIYQQDVASTVMQVFIGEQGDAKQPVLYSSGQLAFTFYGNDAQGDVCLVNPPNKDIACITSNKTVDESPFWIDADHLGYISRDTTQLRWDLVIYDLKTKQSTVIHQGAISAPVASPSGRYVLFNQATETGVGAYLYDRQSGALITPPGFDLPGVTGYSAFSHDEQYVYFNHYLNDTNFDQVINGDDNSVVFRVPFEQWMKADHTILPQQLTSVENNCEFPALSQNYLYVTCAFEGSLDVYRLPLSGSVPAHWNESQISEAHLIARSYEERLLLLNTLRYRFQKDETQMLERLLGNHLQIGELSAADYYIQQLVERYKAAGDLKMVRFYQTLQQLVRVRSSKQRAPAGVVTARLQSLVSETRSSVRNSDAWSRLITLMDAYLDFELQDYDQALKKLVNVNLGDEMLPLERYLVFELYKRLLSGKDPARLLSYYPVMFNSADFTLEIQVYYAFNYLKLLNQVQPDVTARIASVMEQSEKTSNVKLAELLRSEAISLKLTRSKDKSEQDAAFKQLTDLLKNTKNDTLVRKAMHTRAIQILGEANQFQYMELLSRHWLLTTHITEMEFVYVAEQFSVVTMDKAYGMMADGELAGAYSTFYSAILQTNDLEAHYQFITLGLSPTLDRKENLERSYQQFMRQNILGQNDNYVKALRLLLETNRQDKAYSKALDEALKLLIAMPVSGLNPAMRDLLMGYIYHQQFRATQQGYNFDQTLFQKAHYHYMMALDLGRENSRITASVWENLGWLHFDVRQYALSADFFQRRSQMPFADSEAQVNTRWAFARSLFYNNQLMDAWKQAEQALQLARTITTFDSGPFVEKAAFYAMQAGDHQHANELYDELLQKYQLTQTNRAKALLAQGYSLMQAGQRDAARERLQSLLELSNKLEITPSGSERLLAFQPQRLQLLAYGFLTQLSDDPKQQADYLRKRIQLLDNIAGRTTEFAIEESGRLSFLAKDQQRLAAAYEQAGDLEKMAHAMGQALNAATAWKKETENNAGPVIYRTLVNYLSLSLAHPQEFSKQDGKRIEDNCISTLQSFAEQPYRSAIVVAQQAKLSILWEAYRSAVFPLDKQQPKPLAERLDALMNNPEIQQLQDSRSQSYEDLKAMVIYFKNRNVSEING